MPRARRETPSFLEALDNYDKRWLQGQAYLFGEKKPKFHLTGEGETPRRKAAKKEKER